MCPGAIAVTRDLHCTALLQYAHTCFFLQHISYAKGKSDAVAKEDGTFKPRVKKKVEEG